MPERQSDHWSLFENRPARERTSSPAEDHAHAQSGVRKVDTWSSAQRITRVIRLDYVKC